MTAAIKKLKKKHPSALLTVEDLHSIVHQACQAKRNNEDSDEDVIWVEDNSESDDDKLEYMAVEDLGNVKTSLEDNAFIHGIHRETT